MLVRKEIHDKTDRQTDTDILGAAMLLSVHRLQFPLWIWRNKKCKQFQEESEPFKAYQQTMRLLHCESFFICGGAIKHLRPNKNQNQWNTTGALAQRYVAWLAFGRYSFRIPAVDSLLLMWLLCSQAHVVRHLLTSWSRPFNGTITVPHFVWPVAK